MATAMELVSNMREVTLPENGQPLQFDSLDEVAAFLTYIAVKSFQVVM